MELSPAAPLQAPLAAPHEARFELNYQDLREKAKLIAMHSDTQINNVVHPLALAAFIFIPAYVLWAPLLFPAPRAPGPVNWLRALGVILLPELIFAGLLFYVAFQVFKARRKQLAFSEQNRVVLDANGATLHTDGRALAVQWRALRRVVATTDYICLFLGAGEGFIVPRRAFNSDADWQRFVDFASQQWQRDRPTTPPIASV